MREFRFRAWVPEVEKMIPWEHINFELEDGYGGVMDNSTDDVLQDIEDQVTSSFELMQWTGLKDRNGKEIYEGDILHDDFGGHYKGEVYWSEDWAMFAVKGDKGEALIRWASVTEIIGNIYETPELLGRG